MNVSGPIFQLDNDLRDVSGFQFDHALPIDHQCVIGATLDLLRLVVKGVLPHLINRPVAGDAFFRSYISGLGHGLGWNED